MSGVYTNIVEDKLEIGDKMDNCGQKQRSGRRSVAVMCLGVLCLLLLAVIFALAAHNHSVISQWSQHQMIQKENENLTFTVMELQAKLNNLTEAKKEKSRQTGPCPLAWIEVNRECLYISPKGVSKSWANSKKDCEDRKGRLVTVKTRPKLQVLGMFHSLVWIGLSDRETEDDWIWEDGTTLVPDFWNENEPNNHNSNEDCVHLAVENNKIGFNDNNCNTNFAYICERSE